MRRARCHARITYTSRQSWTIKKAGTSRNLGLRVLCLKINMPAYAPNGPKNAIARSVDSGTLQPPLMLMSLSMPKAIVEAELATVRVANRKAV